MLTAWVNSLRGYLEERGLDTFFRIFDPFRNTKVYLLKYWGLDDPDQVVAWENLFLTRIGGALVFYYNVDNLKCSKKYIMNSISLDIWESIKKYLVIVSNGPATYAAVISNIHQVSSSAILNIVDDLRKIYLIK